MNTRFTAPSGRNPQAPAIFSNPGQSPRTTKASCLLLAILLCSTAAKRASAAETFTFTTLDGREIVGAAVSRRTPDGVSFHTPHGVSKIPFEQLPEELQQRFRYDPEAAERFRERMRDAAKIRREATRKAELARRAERDRLRYLPELNTTLSGVVLQVLERGVLLHKADASQPGIAYETRKIQTDGPTLLSPHRKPTFRTVLVRVPQPQHIHLGGGTVYLASEKLAKEAVDGQRIETLAYAIGRFHYTDKAGADRTVAQFTTDAETAAAFARRKIEEERSPGR